MKDLAVCPRSVTRGEQGQDLNPDSPAPEYMALSQV